MKRLLCLTAILLVAACAAFADIAKPIPVKTPEPAPQNEATLLIRLDENETQARLLIPKDQIKQLRAALDEIDDQTDAAAAVTKPGAFSRTQTAVSGIFLSLALVVGGVWFVRSGKSATKTGKVLVIFAVMAGAASAATFVYANAGPPAILRQISSPLFNYKTFGYWKRASGRIKVEATDNPAFELRVPVTDDWGKEKSDKVKTEE